MRKRLLILAAGVVLLALGVAVAVFFVANRPPTPGGLETAPTDVEIVTSTVPKPKPIKRPPPAEKVDNRCWKMFGGGPTRSLARPLIHLGIPVKPPLWARGLQSYVEYPPSYCDGVLYVNTYKGDTWAIKAKTGKVIWRRHNTAVKPSTPAISGALLIVTAKDGTVSALDRRNGRLVWQLRTHAKVESSPAIVNSTAYFGRPMVASMPSGPRPARSAGSTTPADGSTPARRSRTAACASPRTPARSCACGRRTASGSGSRT